MMWTNTAKRTPWPEHVSPRRKKLWFYWTIARLTFRYLIALALAAVLLLLAGLEFRRADNLQAIFLLAGAAMVLLFVFVRLVILRYHIHLGMRRELRRRNCCPHCQYDLRASAVRCPECGRAIAGHNVEV